MAFLRDCDSDYNSDSSDAKDTNLNRKKLYVSG